MFTPTVQDWEHSVTLDDSKMIRRSQQGSYVNWKGEIYQCPSKVISAEACARGEYVSLGELPFRDPKRFIAGGIHDHLDEWLHILGNSAVEQQVMRWIKFGVHVPDFLFLL